MRLGDLKPNPGSRSVRKRVGRGLGSGLGKTSGRGHKGQKARSGGSIRPGFEGGQMPLQRRIPKRGFTNIFRKMYTIINLGDLERFPAGTTVTSRLLLEEGIIRKLQDGLKVLGNGEISVAITVQADAFSRSAASKLTAAGGKAEVL